MALPCPSPPLWERLGEGMSRTRLWQNPGEAEAPVVAPEARVVAEPAGGAAVPGVVAPAPAPVNTRFDPEADSYRIHRPGWRVHIPVQAPLPHIPVHVIQSPRISALRIHGGN